MINTIVNMSLGNRLVVIFFVLLVGVLGVRSMKALPIDAVPDVTNVQVQVLTNAPALGPLEVERFVTFPIETVMSGLPRVEELRSVSRFGLSAVTIVFEEGTDIYRARQLVEERLSAARDAIPVGYGEPEMGPLSSGLGEIYQFEVRGDPACDPDGPDTDACWTPMELRTILEWEVAYQLRSVPGVVEVNTFGGELKTYEVQVDPDRLLALGIGLDRVFQALRENNANAGGAYIEHAGEQRLIRGVGLVESIEDIESIVVETRGEGTPIRIADVAAVKVAAMVRQGAVTRDGRGEVVTGIVMMMLGENSNEVARNVDARIAEIGPYLPEGVTLDTYYDRTELVDRTISTVATNLVEGGVLVIVVLLLLIGNVRGGLLVASVIPLSMLATFIGMQVMGVAGNLMSLGALDFGLIVDGAVVVVENCVRVVGQRKPGEAAAQSVRRAVLQVGRPVVFAVGIIMIVYVPILSLEGIEGKMFKPMALTVIFALAASVVLAITFVPAAATTLFRRGVSEKETWLIRQALRIYLPVLRRTMRRPRLTALSAVLVFASSLMVIPFLGAEFIPRLDEGSIAMQAIRLPSVSLEESVATTTRIEREMLEHFPTEVETVVSRTGRAEIATDPMGVEMSDIYLILRPTEEWQAASKVQLVSEMAEMMEEEFPGQRFTFSQPIELRTNELISGVRSDVAIIIYGEDIPTLARLAESVVDVLQSVPGAADVSAEQVVGLPFLTIGVDRAALSRRGANAKDVLDAVSAMGGMPVGEVFEGQRRFALQVRFPERFRGDLEAIRRIPISTSQGSVVPLGQLATIRLDDGPASISRENVQRRLVIQANVRGRDLAGFVAEAQQRVLDEVDMPPGYLVTWGGQFENLQAATGRLAIAVPIALLLIFIMLQVNYGATRPAVLIYLNVPMAATGGLLALAIRGMPFSISAGVGFIALFGIAVLNGVVLISHVRELQGEGKPLAAACADGARDRLRPVLMTALTDMLGFLPMAVAVSAGAEVQRPLATVVIGGLVTATLLTLVVLPSAYAWLGEEISPRENDVNG
ncbi:MAG TPA: efflux RND transporter permease subunit [Nannocystis exedens]|nr:efflux RND transporter permease subunit [Nannocystis exedens]